VERDGVFTVSVPLPDAMKKELGFCGTKSGRDVNKLESLGLSTLLPAQAA
jgi:flavin reductase (DIM6/NTAB) family NADH-FMN oxidoreductase RutF